jgi:hypothetical protein
MSDIPPWGWYVLAAVPFLSIAASFVLVFVSPTAAGLVSAIGVLFLTPLLAVGLWLWAGDGEDEKGTDGDIDGS